MNFIACFLIQAPLDNIMNSVSFTEFVKILTIGPFLVLTLANIKGLTIKWKISLGDLINKIQVNIFLTINHNRRKSQVLEKCMNNMYFWLGFLKCLLGEFLKGAGQWSIPAWSIYAAEEKSPCIGYQIHRQQDIVLEVKKLSVISSGRTKGFP